MDAVWCTEVSQEAIDNQGKPEMTNTDQGIQFTSEICRQTVLLNQIKLSMDGKGGAIDKGFIERLWRSVTYENVYLNPPDFAIDLYRQLKDYFQYYNNQRRHQEIESQIPINGYVIHKKTDSITNPFINLDKFLS